MEQVGRLAIIGPGESQVQGQVLADLPVIATVDKCVVLAEVADRVALGDRNCTRNIVEVVAEASELIDAVDARQKNVGRALVGEIGASLQLVLTQNVVPVVLRLPRVHNASLGQIVRRTETKPAGDRHRCQGLLQVARRWIGVANAVSSEAYIQAAEGNTRLIHHVRREVVRLTEKNALAQGKNIDHVSRSAVILSIEVVATIKQIASAKVIVTA